MVVSPNVSDSPRVVGRYMLFDEIAAGGMATVRFGRLMGEVGFSRTVAVKCLHPQFAKDQEFAKMFLDEAKLAARVRHPNVVPILDVVSRDGELFLVMEYVQGESLSKLVRGVRARKSRIPLRIVASIMAGALDGLHAAHEAKSEHGEPLGIVHRDVSPQNVIVGLDGVSRVLDFGVAKAAGRMQTTQSGQLKGKLAYMSPEQLKGDEVDRRTDVYAASVVLWEALTGRRLFKADDEIGVFGKVLEGNIKPPSSVISSIPRGYDEVTMKGLHRDPAQRYPTAREMAIALEKVAGVASPREVGTWVEELARDTLRQRAEKIAELESVSTMGFAGSRGSVTNEAVSPVGPRPLPPPVPPPRRDGSTSGVQPPPPVSITNVPPGQDQDDDALTIVSDTTASSIHLAAASAAVSGTAVPNVEQPASSVTDLTSLSMAQAAPPAPQPTGPKPGVLVAVIGVAVIAAMAAVAALAIVLGAFEGEDARAGGVDAGVADSAAAATAVPAVGVDTASETDGGGDPESQDAGLVFEEHDAAPDVTQDAKPEAGKVARPANVGPPRPVGTAAPPPATTTAAPPPPPTRTSPPPRPPAPKGDCNPPYTIDSRGVRVPKLHCL